MLLLLFEVTPREGRVDEYLAIAAQLRPELDAMGERIYRPGEYAHVVARDAGQPAPMLTTLPGARRLRLGEIERDYGMGDRVEAPQYYAPVTRHPGPMS